MTQRKPPFATSLRTSRPRRRVEAERLVGIVDGDERGGEVDCHETTVRSRASDASPILLSSRQGCDAARRDLAHARRHDLEVAVIAPRYCDGVSPTISVKRELNEPSDVQPTAKQVSVTDIP